VRTWYEADNPNGWLTGKRFRIDAPAPTVMAGGMGGDSLGHWHIHTDGKDHDRMGTTTAAGKPAYRVPSMAEINAVPWNGYTVASTFSGCGGSCLGYRMAGFRVAWANEFVPAAQDSYRANMTTDSYLDPRDIKLVQPSDILDRLNMQPGDLDLLDGSPPCQAFSTAGQREKGWGKNKVYEHGARQRNETLFDEYIRLVRGLRPKVFIAENVSGLVKGTAKGYFLEILRALKASGYVVETRLLDAQWLGVPQMRQRIIFQGVRADLAERYGVGPVFPTPLPYRYSVREALPWIGAAIHDTSGQYSYGDITDGPSPTVVCTAGTHWVETVAVGRFDANGYNAHAPQNIGQPMATVQAGRPVRVIHNTGGAPDRPGNRSAGDITDRPSPAVTIGVNSINSYHFLVEEMVPLPPSRQRADAFNTSIDDAGVPCPTVTCASPGNDLAVPVPGQTTRRKFMIAELKRICAFPDDFTLTGSYAQQWERLGNSVPPLMMRAVAEVVRDRVLAKVN